MDSANRNEEDEGIMNRNRKIVAKLLPRSITRRSATKSSKRLQRLEATYLHAELLEARYAPDGTPLVGALDVSNNHVADNNFSPNDLGKTQRDLLSQTLKDAKLHPGYWNFFVGGDLRYNTDGVGGKAGDPNNHDLNGNGKRDAGEQPLDRGDIAAFAAKYNDPQPKFPAPPQNAAEFDQYMTNIMNFVEDLLSPDVNPNLRSTPSEILSWINAELLGIGNPMTQNDFSNQGRIRGWNPQTQRYEDIGQTGFICHDHAVLFASLVRELGFPAREVNVTLAKPSAMFAQGFEYWYQEAAVEVWFGGKWNYFDPYLLSKNPDDNIGGGDVARKVWSAKAVGFDFNVINKEHGFMPYQAIPNIPDRAWIEDGNPTDKDGNPVTAPANPLRNGDYNFFKKVPAIGIEQRQPGARMFLIDPSSGLLAGLTPDLGANPSFESGLLELFLDTSVVGAHQEIFGSSYIPGGIEIADSADATSATGVTAETIVVVEPTSPEYCIYVWSASSSTTSYEILTSVTGGAVLNMEPSYTGTVEPGDPQLVTCLPRITVNNPALVSEGNTDINNITFTVSLDRDPFETVTLMARTADLELNPPLGSPGNGAAKADVDYTTTVYPAANPITFALGDPLTKTITVPIHGDTISEFNEMFRLILEPVPGVPLNAIFADAEGIGVIEDDDGDPITPNDCALNPLPGLVSCWKGEGNFSDSADGNGGGPVGNVTFAPGILGNAFSLDGFQDGVNLGNPANLQRQNFTISAWIRSGQQVGQDPEHGGPWGEILCYGYRGYCLGLAGDGHPFLSEVGIGNIGGGTSVSDTQWHHLAVSTVNGNVLFYVDGVSAGGGFYNPTYLFTTNVDIGARGDDTSGSFFGQIDEVQFYNRALTADEVHRLYDMATVLPMVSVLNAIASEGDEGSTEYQFPLRVTPSAPHYVAVYYTTADFTATVTDHDYEPKSEIAIIPPGQNGTIPVLVNGDTKYEITEDFRVNILDRVNATRGNDFGIGRINNDDSIPVISVNDLTEAEGDQATTDFPVVVFLSNPSYQTITVNLSLATGGTSTAGTDFTSFATIPVTFNPDETAKGVIVTVAGDLTYELDETIHVRLSLPTNATLADDTAIVTILNDDPIPVVTISDVSLPEGNAFFGITFPFTVTLSNPSYLPIALVYRTQDGTAKSFGPGDYQAVVSPFTIPAGATTGVIPITIRGDHNPEEDETFFVNLTLDATSTAVLGDDQGQGTILDDDAGYLFIQSARAQREGNGGTLPYVFTVTLLRRQPTKIVTVRFATADGTATLQDNDYQPVNGTLTFGAGETEKTITVLINGDLKAERLEFFRVALSNASNAAIVRGTANGYIRNDDQLITIFSTASAVYADLNGDGLEDRAAIAFEGNAIIVGFGNVQGGFGQEQSYQVEGSAWALAVEDFDDDGVMDISVALLGEELPAIYLGSGDGSFTLI